MLIGFSYKKATFKFSFHEFKKPTYLTERNIERLVEKISILGKHPRAMGIK
jgi:hypothetical protein